MSIFVCVCVCIYLCVCVSMCEWVYANAVGLDGNQKTMLQFWLFPSTSVCALGNPPYLSVKLSSAKLSHWLFDSGPSGSLVFPVVTS